MSTVTSGASSEPSSVALPRIQDVAGTWVNTVPVTGAEIVIAGAERSIRNERLEVPGSGVFALPA
ncbi:MAG: hypothetical protein ACO1QR_03920, partial [Chthoniobacteraceae bacterium]